MKKIILLSVITIASLKSASGQTVTQELEAVINTYEKHGRFTGTVLVANKQGILYQKGVGYRDITGKRTNSVNTIYQLASLAKQFTAAIVLKLEESGKLSVNDKLSKYYPGYPEGEKITIHHLLSHTSGIFNYTDSKEFMSADQSRPVSLDSMIRIFINKPLAFEPGTRFRYSNSGYTLLGYIIEKITGKSYRHVLETMILKPLKLVHTGYDYGLLTDTSKSVGYANTSNANYQPATYVHSSILYTTGALYSTVGDLYQWNKILMNHTFLSDSSLKKMYTPAAGPYGYGWSVDSWQGKKRVSHSGNVAGFKANINRIPEDSVCIIALSNSNSSSVGEMVMILLSVVYDKPYKIPFDRKEIRIDSMLLKKYTGVYEFPDSFSLHIFIEGGKLFVQTANQPSFELFAEKEDYFFMKAYDMQFDFRKNVQTGIVEQLIFYKGQQAFTGSKKK